MPARILIVEKEAPLVRLMRRNLESAGYQVEAVARDAEAAIRIRDNAPDLVVLDALTPGLADTDLCERVRSYAGKASVPIIALVNRDVDGLRGLDAGADSFIVKPLSAPQLLARVGALLRRVKPYHDNTMLRLGDIVLDRDCHRAKRANRDLHLGPTEFRLLAFLMENPERVFTRAELLASIWGPNAKIDLRTIDVHIGRLRKALKIGNWADPLRTVRGSGYALQHDQSASERNAPQPAPIA